MSEHELVGRLVDDYTTGVVFRIEAVDLDAFPAERELDMKPVYVRPRSRFMGTNDPPRSPESVAKWMRGRGRHSIAWARLMPTMNEADLIQLGRKP